MFPVESVHRFRFRCARPVVDSCSTYIPVTWSKMTDGWVWVWWIDHGPMVYQHLNNLPTKMWMKCWFPMIYQHVINISKTQMPKNLSSKFRAPWTLPGGMQLHGGFLLLGLLRAAGVFSASRRFTKWGYQPTGLVLLGCSPSWCHELPSQPGRTLPHAAEGQLSADRLGRRSESQHHSGALVGKTLVIWCWLSRGVSCHMCVQIIINHLWHDDVVYYRCFFFETGPPTLKKHYVVSTGCHWSWDQTSSCCCSEEWFSYGEIVPYAIAVCPASWESPVATETWLTLTCYGFYMGSIWMLDDFGWCSHAISQTSPKQFIIYGCISDRLSLR